MRLYLLLLLFYPSASLAEGLLSYVNAPDSEFAVEEVGRTVEDGGTFVDLTLTSQRWRGIVWSHPLRVYLPKQIRSSSAFLYLASRSTAYDEMLRKVAVEGGIITAALGGVPNQPLFDGLKEDHLIAYTFDRYRKSGDPDWPLLFPMVKSAVKAMDAIETFCTKECPRRVTRFIVSGASKRGWTTWLTAAADPRVSAIAPLVFDMLNMKVQTDWAASIYGAQSEKIKPYTELGLIDEIEAPPLVRLRQWVDPYTYRSKLSMPKLILLGSNDPYWTVDALKHYYPDLPGSTLLYNAANFGHALSGSHVTWKTLAAWTARLAAGAELPRLTWHIRQDGARSALLEATSTQPILRASVWRAVSKSRDFRNAVWERTPVEVAQGATALSTSADLDPKSATALLLEVLTGEEGVDLKPLTLSSTVEVFTVGDEDFASTDVQRGKKKE